VRKQYQPSLLQVLSRGFFQWSVSWLPFDY
jgi:hypothetical protein